MTQTPQSEVAAIFERIRQEDEAMRRGLHGFAQGTSRHSFISTRYANLEDIATALKQYMPHDQAWTHIVEQLENAPL